MSGSESKKSEGGLINHGGLRGAFSVFKLLLLSKNWTWKAPHLCLSKTLSREWHWKQRAEIIEKHPPQWIKGETVFKLSLSTGLWDREESVFHFFCLNKRFLNDYSNPKWIPTKLSDCEIQRMMLPSNGSITTSLEFKHWEYSEYSTATSLYPDGKSGNSDNGL